MQKTILQKRNTLLVPTHIESVSSSQYFLQSAPLVIFILRILDGALALTTQRQGIVWNKVSAQDVVVLP